MPDLSLETSVGVDKIFPIMIKWTHPAAILLVQVIQLTHAEVVFALMFTSLSSWVGFKSLS